MRSTIRSAFVAAVAILALSGPALAQGDAARLDPPAAAAAATVAPGRQPRGDRTAAQGR